MFLKGKYGALAAGYVPSDAELRQVGPNSTDRCMFAVKGYEDEAERGEKNRKAHWLNIVCWGGTARYAAGIRKGDSVLAAGRIQKRTYTDQNGVEKTVTELVADCVQIQITSGEGGQPGGEFSVDADDFTEADEDDVPF